MTISRRELAGAALIGGAAIVGGADARPAKGAREHGPRPDPSGAYIKQVKGGERIAMIAYPGCTALDLLGPHWFLKTMRGAKVDIVAATRDPVQCDRDVTILPNLSFDEVPAEIDLLFVPGAGFATLAAIDDPRLLDFVADRGGRARYVGGICTGVMVLGAAGLLQGYRATAHWQLRDACLPAFGATPVNARFVEDRNRLTGAGVTAGLDFGLNVARKLRGADNARLVQLLAEYDPQPIYDSGSPDTAWPETVKTVKDMLPGFNQKVIEIGRRRLEARNRG